MNKIQEAVHLACIDDETGLIVVQNNQFVLTVPAEKLQSAKDKFCVPSSAIIKPLGNDVVIRWPSYADEIFQNGGTLAGVLPGYAMRKQQLYAARLFQRSLEMSTTCVIEAGTGVGKSLLYLMIARRMGKRIVVSTSNKTLQMQLAYKDAPLVASIYPSKVVMLQGKRNYICEKKLADGDYGVIEESLKSWCLATKTGNVQEITFEVKPDEIERITIDDGCAGRACHLFDNCFYYSAKAEAQNADIIIINHSLLAMNTLYPFAKLLPLVDVVVIDEAHELAEYLQKALSTEITTGAIERVMGKEFDISPFIGSTSGYVFGKSELEVTVNDNDTFPLIKELAENIEEEADLLWNRDWTPQLEPDYSECYGDEQCKEAEFQSAKAQYLEDMKKFRKAKRMRNLAEKLFTVALPTAPGYVRWIKKANNKTADAVCVAPYSVKNLAMRLMAPQIIVRPNNGCACCGATLQNRFFVLEDEPYCAGCIVDIDIENNAEPATSIDYKPQVAVGEQNFMLCSATLGTPKLEPFMAEVSITDAMTIQVTSPFDYRHNARIYVPNSNAPTAKSGNDEKYHPFIVSEIKQLIEASGGGAFLLFTSNKALNYVRDILYPQLFNKYPVFVQGMKYPKLEIIRRMKDCDNGVLFATRSFFAGADIPGDSLRLVVLDKLPFTAPNPLSNAKGEDLRRWARENLALSEKDLEFYPFNQIAIPEMIITAKQAFGRLIRGMNDKGVVAILDNRALTTDFGRRHLIPSLPDAPIVREISEVKAFFDSYRNRKIAELSPLELGKELFGVKL